MIKIEKWNGHDIRFVEHNGEWCAVAIDIAKALEYANPSMAIHKHCKGVSKLDIPSRRGRQKTNIISEIEIYNLIFKAADQSRNIKIKEKAEEFKTWIFKTIKRLRESAGLEGFEIFKMLDAEQQKEAMKKLDSALGKAAKIDYVKANTITNKAVSNLYGYPKALKKKEMQPDMLIKRQSILDETVNLMAMNSMFNLGISVSDKIYEKYKSQGGA